MSGDYRLIAKENLLWECDVCGTIETILEKGDFRQKTLTVHHRDCLPKTHENFHKDNSLENLQVLCTSCHTKIHNRLRVVSDETRRKQSVWCRDEETRKKISDGHKGLKHSAETKKKMGENRKGELHPMYGKVGANKGKIFSKETREKMSVSKKGMKHSDETKQKMREHSKVSIKMIFIPTGEIFNTRREAYKFAIENKDVLVSYLKVPKISNNMLHFYIKFCTDGLDNMKHSEIILKNNLNNVPELFIKYYGGEE